MKNKKRFLFFLIVYIIGFLYFCIFQQLGEVRLVKDIPALLLSTVKISYVPVSVRKLPAGLYIWTLVSTVFIPFILWQTKLEGQKLNRAALLCIGLNVLLIGLSTGLVDWIKGEDYFMDTFLTVLLVLVLVLVGGLLLAIFFQKKSGEKISYENFTDVMTEEEYENLKEKIQKIKDKFKL